MVVIPTYNEAKNIERLILKLLERFSGIRIVVVDDNSPDGTAQIIQRLAKTNERVKLLWREEKSGLASAYLDAFARILPDPTIDYVVEMDADFSHDPEDLGKLLRAAADDQTDVVVGSRYVSGGEIKNWSKPRMLLSQLANRYAKWVTGVPIADLTAGFAIYHRNLLAKILQSEIKSEGYAFQIEMKYLAYHHGANIVEVPITFYDRSAGRSKLSRRVIWEGIIIPWYLRFFR